MKELGNRKPDNFKNEWKYPNIFHDREYPLHFDFFPAFRAMDSKQIRDGTIVGFAHLPFTHHDRGKEITIPRDLLVWDGDGVCAMGDDLYREKYLV